MKKLLTVVAFVLLAFSIAACTGATSITIHFETNGGNVIEDMIVNADDTSFELPTPVKEGYTFDSWYTNEDLTSPFSFASLLTATEITVYARWNSEVTSYTITFEVNGGSAVAPIVAASGATIPAPTPPTKANFTFGGWYSDVALTTAYTFSVMPAQNLTLYAKWNAVIAQTTITFEVNGGSAVAAITQNIESAVTAPASPTKTGYTFGGWYSDVGLSTAYVFSTMPNTNITLYAKWTINQYTITFEENGGTAVTDITQAYLSAVTTPTPPTKAGYTFGGWYSDVALTTAYVFSTMPAQNTTLYAKWTANQYTITFEENEGSAVTDITQAYMSAVTTPTPPTKTGYTFGGWYSDVGLSTAYTFGTMPLNGITLYAKWTINQYTITFEENGGSPVTDITQDYLSVITAPTPPTKTGFTFGGWYSDIPITTAYTFTSMPASNITLYAKWDIVVYTITFIDFLSGNDLVLPIQLPTGATITLPVPTPFEGFEFLGWYTDIQFTTPFVGTEMPDHDFTLYGDWIQGVYTITYETNGGTVYDTAQVPYMDQIPNPGIPVKEGYIFGGWYADAELTLPYEFLDMPASDMTVYAKWVAEEGFYPIDLLLINQPAEPVTVHGVIYYVFPDAGNPGFYLYDGTGYIFVLHLSTGFMVGDGIEVTASFDLFENTPQLVDVTNITPDGTFTTMPNFSEMLLEYLTQVPEENLDIYGTPVLITGVVGNNGPDYYLTVLSSNDVVMINYKSYLPMSNPFETLVGQTVTIQAIIHDYNGYSHQWHILYNSGASIEVTELTDQEKLDLLVAFATEMLDNEVFYNGQNFMIPESEPVYGASLAAETFGDNASYYDPTTGEFVFIPVEIEIGLRITVTIGELSEIFDLTIILRPIETMTVAEFLMSDDMEMHEVVGVVIFVATDTDMQMMVIADETGILGVVSSSVVEVGDSIRVLGYKMMQDGAALLANDPEMTLVEIIDHDQDVPIDPIAITVEQFNSLDPNNPVYWLQYFEISGVLQYDQFKRTIFLEDGMIGMPIFAFDMNAQNLLNTFTGLEIRIRGISLPSFDQEGSQLMLVFSGRPEDIILDYTDVELLDAIAQILTDYLGGYTYFPGQIIELPRDHPAAPITMTYELLGDDIGLLDLLTGEISPTIESEITFDLHATLTYGELTQITIIEIHVAPMSILSVTDFYQLTDYENSYYVQGVVILIQPPEIMVMGIDEHNFTTVMIADEHSVATVMITEIVNLGDLIIVNGYKEHDGGIVIVSGNPEETFVEIVSHDNPHPMTKEVISMSDFLDIDMTLPENMMHYYQISGTLVENEEYHVFFIQDGELNVSIFPISQEAYMGLLQFKDMDVLVSGLSFPNSEVGNMLMFTNYPGDLVPNMTPEGFAAYIEDLTISNHLDAEFRPGTMHILEDDFPPFLLTIVYEVTSNAELYNLETGMISADIDTPTYIDITATIYIDGVYYDEFSFQIHVVPVPILTVTEFFNLTDNENEYLVEGIVVYIQPEQNLVMIADADHVIMVMSEETVHLGDLIKARGFRMDSQGMIMLVGNPAETIVAIVSNGNFNPLVGQEISLSDFMMLNPYDSANSLIYYEFVATLREDTYNHMFYLDDGENQVPIFAQRPEDYAMLQTYSERLVRLRGLSMNAGDAGMLMILFINLPGDIELPYTVDEYVDLLATELPQKYDDMFFIPGQTYLLPTSDPDYAITFSYELLGLNADKYNIATGLISGDIVTALDIEVTATIQGGSTTQIVVLIFHVIPPVVVTIDGFINGTTDVLYQIQGIVLISMPDEKDGATLIADATGQVFVVYPMPVYVGDEVILVGYQELFEGMMVLGVEHKVLLVDTLSSNNTLPVTPIVQTIDDLYNIDMTDIANWGLYVEVTGFISVYDEYDYIYISIADGFNGENTFEISAATKDVMEMLYEYNGLEVILRGFLLPDYSDDYMNPYPMLFFTGYEGSLELNYSTDQEKIEALINLGHFFLESEPFSPGDDLMLPPEFPVLGATVVWEIVSGPAEIYDFETGMIADVLTIQTLIFSAEITVGTTIVNQQFDVVIEPIPILTISDFYMTWYNESAKIQGVVTAIIDDYRSILMDGSGMILIDNYVGLNVGDEIVVYGEHQVSEMTDLMNGENGGFYDVLNTGVTPTIPVSPMTLEDIANFMGPLSVLHMQYVNLVGRLYFSNDDNLFHITNGSQMIYIFNNDPDVYALLNSFLDTDVSLFAYTYMLDNFYHGLNWSVFFAGESGEISFHALSDDEVVDMLTAQVDQLFSMGFDPNTSPVLPDSNPIYGGAISYATYGPNAIYATLYGNELAIGNPLVSVLVDMEVTVTYGLESRVLYLSLAIQVGDNPYGVAAGSLGVIPSSLESTMIADLFGGFYISEVARENDFISGTNLIVDLSFPAPSVVGADYYTLQYYDDVTETWIDFDYESFTPLTTMNDNFSLNLDEGYTFRLITSGVIGGELVSNSVEVPYTLIETNFTGWSLDMSMFISGVMYPYEGCGLTAEAYVSDLDGNVLSDPLNYQWYRVNPYTFEMTEIMSATNQTYITNSDDIGYLILVKISGDEVNVGGFTQVLSDDTIKLYNPGFINQVSVLGFNLNLGFTVDSIDVLDYIHIYDQDYNELTIGTISPTINPAIFTIEMDLSGVSEITINIENDAWVLGTFEIFEYGMPGLSFYFK